MQGADGLRSQLQLCGKGAVAVLLHVDGVARIIHQSALPVFRELDFTGAGNIQGVDDGQPFCIMLKDFVSGLGPNPGAVFECFRMLTFRHLIYLADAGTRQDVVKLIDQQFFQDAVQSLDGIILKLTQGQ